LLRPAFLSAASAGGDGALDEALGSTFQLGAGQRHVEMLGPLASAVMKGRLISVEKRAGQLNLGLLSSFLQTLERLTITLESMPLITLELSRDISMMVSSKLSPPR